MLASDHAATMSTPGALRSGCKNGSVCSNKSKKNIHSIILRRKLITFRISTVIGFGPLDENETT